MVWLTLSLMTATVGGPVTRVYVGTYTSRNSQGIYRFNLDQENGAVESKGLAADAVNPSFLAIHPSGKWLYAVGEVDDLKGVKGGGVSAFAIDPATGALTLINQQSSKGGGPCHLTVDRSGRCVLVANYGGGSTAVLPINADGSLKQVSSFIQHRGSSVNRQRQEGPHAHSVNVDPTNRFAVTADLGLDQLLVFRFVPELGRIEPNDPSYFKVAPGSGPRHFAFHPDGRRAFVINELASTVTALRFDPTNGILTETQTISTLPPGYDGENHTSEIQVHPSGRFVFGSNRGHNSIAVFSVGDDSQLTPVVIQRTGGRTPRNFGIDPSGRFLFAANQDSDNIVVFAIDPTSGRLSPFGPPLSVPFPVCVKFLNVTR